jgi:hypothetical protein
MNAADGLLQMCRIEMIPEPLQFKRDADGAYHWATEVPPIKTVIDPRAGVFMWIKCSGDTVTVELDGKSVVYHRIAFGPHGEWICSLMIGEFHGAGR